MSNVNITQYLPTEVEISGLFRTLFGDASGYDPRGAAINKFVRDYTSIKQNEVKTVTAVNAATGSIETLQAQVFTISNTLTAVQAQIVVINNQIITINGQLTALTGQVTALDSQLASHVAAQSAHGANGDIVGTNDYCTASIGGTVLLASAVANAAPVSTTPPAVVAAAGATYSQAYTQTQTDTINALRQNVIDLVAANNALVSVVNQMLASERTAKQRSV